MAKQNFRKQVAIASGQTSAQSAQALQAARQKAIVLHQQGNLKQAIAHYQKALVLAPYDAELHNNVGVALEASGQLDRAIAHYQEAVKYNPHYPQAFTNLGNTLQKKERLEEAIFCYQQAIALQPNYPKAHTNLGNVLRQQGKLEEAIVHFRKAFVLQPNQISAHLNLASALQEWGTEHGGAALDEAISLYRSVLQHQPSATVYAQLGSLLWQKEKFEEAAAYYQQAIGLEPENCGYHNNLAVMLQESGCIKASISAFQSALALAPNNPEIRANYGVSLLASGNLQQGFAEYELRLQCETFLPHALPHPLWDGSDLAGKTILVGTEQGLGDAIQFIRYTLFLVQQGAFVSIQCPQSLARLFQSIPGIRAVNMINQVDYCIPVMSLAHRFNTTQQTIPTQLPYLSAPSPKAELQLSSDLFRVGIVWASGFRPALRLLRSYQQRSCPLSTFLKAVDVPGVKLYSLQVGTNAVDLKHFGYDRRVIDLTPHIEDFADTASLIEQLDLVITVDTAVAHLAGALNKPVWVMLPHVPDWRWMMERADTPWYPSMRLFRQPKPGDWDSVVNEVRSALSAVQAGRMNVIF